jgi:hypothetical protein
VPTTTVTNRNFTSTPQVFGPVTIPQKAMDEDGIKIQLTSNDWSANPGRTLSVNIEQSFDSGASWRDWASNVFTTDTFGRDGALPSITLKTDDGHGVFTARHARVTVSAPTGTVNAGAFITF